MFDTENHSQLEEMLCFLFADEEYSILPRNSKRNQLHTALESERFEDASRLIGSGSETNLVECFESREKFFKSSLHIIAAINDTQQATELCRQLLQRISNTKNREYLLNMTTVDEFNIHGTTVRARVAAIHIAAYSNNSGVVRMLCEEYGVDTNCSTSEMLKEKPIRSITALHWAAWSWHTEVVKVLLDNKADLNARRTDDGATALHTAAYSGHREIVKLLLDNKADVNARRTNDDATPLYFAAQNGHTDVVKVLIDNKADVNARSPRYFGEKPVDAARRNHHSAIVDLFR